MSEGQGCKLVHGQVFERAVLIGQRETQGQVGMAVVLAQCWHDTFCTRRGSDLRGEPTSDEAPCKFTVINQTRRGLGRSTQSRRYLGPALVSMSKQ